MIPYPVKEPPLTWKFHCMIKVFICDAHKLVIEGMELILSESSEISIAGFSLTGEEAVVRMKSNPADIILLDINLPGKNGIEICKQLSAEAPAVKVIALTMIRDLSLVKLMLKNGARGYILKNAGKEEVIHAILSVHAGNRYLDSKINEMILNDMTEGPKKKTDTDVFPKLSRRELEILQLIMDELTAAEIAVKLFISLGTVETHRRNILSKLGARNTAGLVRIAMEYNLLG